QCMFCAPTLTEVPDRISFTSRTAVNGGMTKRWISAERPPSAAFSASAKTRASASVLFIFQLVPTQHVVTRTCFLVCCYCQSDPGLLKIGQNGRAGRGVGDDRVEIRQVGHDVEGRAPEPLVIDQKAGAGGGCRHGALGAHHVFVHVIDKLPVDGG